MSTKDHKEKLAPIFPEHFSFDKHFKMSKLHKRLLLTAGSWEERKIIKQAAQIGARERESMLRRKGGDIFDASESKARAAREREAQKKS